MLPVLLHVLACDTPESVTIPQTDDTGAETTPGEIVDEDTARPEDTADTADTAGPEDTGTAPDPNADEDGDGFPASTDCDDTDPLVHPDEPEFPYDGIDNDCDAATPDDDLDGDGHGLADDCNDRDASQHDGESVVHEGDVTGGFTTLCASACQVSIEGDLDLEDATAADVAALTCVVSVSGALSLSDARLTDLQGLGNLQTIGDNIEYYDTSVSLHGLDRLTTVGGELNLNEEETMRNLRAVRNLTTLGSLDLVETGLVSLDGLENITSLDRLRMNKNPAISDISALSGVTRLGSLIIWNHGVRLDLAPLSQITELTFLSLRYTNIESLAPLSNVSSATLEILYLYGNDQLTDLDGLEGIVETEQLTIEYNDILTNVDGLSGLAAVTDGFSVLGNDRLTDLDGLSALASIGGDLDIQGNDVITDVTGMSALSSVGGHFYINHNPCLESDNAKALRNSVGIDNIEGTITISSNDGPC